MIKLITDNDLDGNSCFIVAKIFLNEDIDVTKSGPKKVNNDVLEVIQNHEQYSKIFITDLSVNSEVAKELDKISNKLCLLDHHVSAEFLNDYSWANVHVKLNDRKTCGAELLLNYLYENMNQNSIDKNHRIFDFVEITRRYDTWEWYDVYNDDIPKKMNDLMYIKGKDEFTDEMLIKIKSGEEPFDTIDIALLTFRQKEIEREIDKLDDKIVTTDILGYKAGVVFTQNFISEVGNQLSERHPELDFIAIINGSSVSFRTAKDDINVSEIAKVFGGGGHVKASGCGIDSKLSKKYIDSIFKVSFFDRIFRKIKYKK